MKARARALRWEEELELLPEEIRRAIAFWDRQATIWEDRAGARGDVTPELREGLAAYAARQADIRRGWSARCASLWQKTLAGADVDDAVEESNDSSEKVTTAGDGDDDDDDDGVVEIEEPEDVVAYLEMEAEDYV